MPKDKVRVVCEFMGGGFGSKNGPDEYTFVAAELAKRTGRPVRCALTRREEHTAAGNRNATIQRLRAGAKSDGTIVALDGEFTNAVGWSGWNAGTEGPMKMLYDCENVRTTTYGAKINTPPMKAFRAPGFVEGTFGLECLVDALAAKLDMDPLELRRRNYAATNEGTPISSKELEECYKRAEPHWERRHEVRSRSDAVMEARRRDGVADLVRRRRASVLRLGARRLRRSRDGDHGDAGHRHGDEDRDGADRGGGAAAAARHGRCRRSATRRAGRTRPSPPARRRCRRWGRPCAPRPPTRASRSRTSPSSAACRATRRSHEVVDLLEDAQILGKGARGPNPTGMSVLTFGVHVVEVAVDVETGEVVVERVAAIHDVGRIVNPLGASSQVEGGIIQGIGHTLSEDRLLDPETGRVLTSTLDAYRMPTIADVPEIVCEFVDKPDTHLTNLGSKGLGEPPIVPDLRRDRERDPRRDGRRDLRAADLARGDAARARGCEEEGEAWSSCGRLSSPSSTAVSSSTAGRRSCRCCRTGCSRRRRSSTCAASCRAASTARTIGAGTTLGELEVEPAIPDALREACRLAASPQLRNMGSLGGNLLQATRCWYWRLDYPCRLHGGDRCHARDGEHREHAIFANDFCASAHPSDVAAALVALGARLRTNRRELAVEELYRLPDEGDRRTTTLEAGELILEVELPDVEASVYLKAMDRKRWSFPQVGVAVARVGGETRIALAGVAPIPWRIYGIEELDAATPLPRTEWKLPLARALVARALAALG